MPKPRYAQISLDHTPYYHCMSRCVRRAYLCGKDTHSGQSYEHRRQWIEDKLHQLVQVFSIQLCGYAVMSNHYHVVLHVDMEEAKNWSRDDIVSRWHKLFKGNHLSQRYQRHETLDEVEMLALEKIVETWRTRLMSISWFMAIVNQYIARRANAEDKVTGRFWEGRFGSQALLDDVALMTCLAYVDLNPIRAQMASTPETSDYTSVKQRIRKAAFVSNPNHHQQQPETLFPFAGNPRRDSPKGLPFQLTDYLDLVDWSGRIMQEGKPGVIDNSLSPILERLNLEPKHWGYLTKHFESRFKRFVGGAYKLKQVCAQLGYQRTPGLRGCEAYFP